MAVGMFLGAIGMGVVSALADAPMMDPVKLSPQYYKVRLDNARVRVLEYHLKPGEKEMMHSHPEGPKRTSLGSNSKTARSSFAIAASRARYRIFGQGDR